MLIRRLQEPVRAVRQLRTRSGTWLRGIVRQQSGHPPSDHPQSVRPESVLEATIPSAQQLASRLANLESQLEQLVNKLAEQEPEVVGLPTDGALRMPPLPDDFSDFSDTPSSHVTSAPRGRGLAGPIVRGSVSGVGLGTLFNLFENERLAGILSLRSERRKLEFLFREGGIVHCECDGKRIAAAEGVQIACTWLTAEFDFRRDLPDEEVDAPRSANVLLLDALRERDERACR